jgi:hypothetical protein
MNTKLRLDRLEKAAAETTAPTTEVPRTPEFKRVMMEIHLHNQEIVHDDIDEQEALACARRLHHEPFMLPGKATEPPADVQAQLDDINALIMQDFANLPAAEQMAIERRQAEHERRAQDFLDRAAA